LSTGALAGIRVLDTTRALAGPLCTMILGDLGADVIKVEMPGIGDETRFWGPPFAGGDAGPTLIGYNRSKRSVAIDLHTTEGQQTCLQLAKSADVFVENFRPGTAERFGLGYEQLRAIRPDIVYCSISGYGQTGPMSQRPAVDLMVQAVSGLMSLTGDPAGRPFKAAAPVADTMAGMSAALSIMAALMERRHTGQGRYLDIAMLDAMVALMGQSVAGWGIGGKAPSRWGNGHPLMAPYESFRTADREIVVAVTNEKIWGALAHLPEFSELTSDPKLDTPPKRNEQRLTLVPAFEAILQTKPAAYWISSFDSVGIPAELIYSMVEILEHPQVRERGILQEVEYPPGSGQQIITAGMPWRQVASDKPIRPPPTLGQHTKEVLDELLPKRASPKA
jgi:crotonobetainyl-CoA:carnitine CoA-transferase CaiB-like acyl-CoA transferase